MPPIFLTPLFVLAVFLLSPGPGAAQQPRAVDHEAEYAACLALVDDDPYQAFEGALDWRMRGGAVPAEHCAALAVLAMGYPRDAAGRLEEIAEREGLDDALRAEAAAQAADAWERGDDIERSLAALDRAVALAPGTARFHVDRGVLYLELGRTWDAIDDFDLALDLHPNRPEALQFRATAYRLVEAYDLAETDLVRLLNLDPGSPEAFLELGEVRLAQGDRRAAQEAFLLTLENTDADTALAAAARAKIEEMALGTRN
ncbi:MAG: tetratricopeptide repeat protein [Alphaproteobacteria bacterium]|nr:tetratricopeptide repeat protein [Alphaproteobacteria bacterium]